VPFDPAKPEGRRPKAEDSQHVSCLETAEIWIPKSTVFIDKIPITKAEKLDKQALRKDIEES